MKDIGDEEYVEEVVTLEVKLLIQVRKEFRATDRLGARGRFRQHIEGNTGPANILREDPGILSARITKIS